MSTNVPGMDIILQLLKSGLLVERMLSNGAYLLSYSNGSWRTGGEKGKGNCATNSGLADNRIDALNTAQSTFML